MTRRGGRISWVSVSGFGRSVDSDLVESNQWIKIDTSNFIAMCSALLWHWQAMDNVTVWYLIVLAPWSRRGVGQRYKVTMRVFCHKFVPVLIWPWMLLGCKTTTDSNSCFIYGTAIMVCACCQHLNALEFRFWTEYPQIFLNFRYFSVNCIKINHVGSQNVVCPWNYSLNMVVNALYERWVKCSQVVCLGHWHLSRPQFCCCKTGRTPIR